MKTLACVVAVVAWIGAGGIDHSTRGQTPQQPSGTALIRGAVLDAVTGMPVRRASLRLRMTAPSRAAWTAVTDATGAFEFPALPAGRFVLSASKGGFIALGPGQRSLTDAPRPIETADGRTVDLPPIRLPRGGVISGRVGDEYGDAVPEITVQAFRAQYRAGVRRLVSVRSGKTNDIGQFRIYGLQPGTYYVAASSLGTDAGPVEIMEPGIQAVRGGGGFAPTFFPGTVRADEAQRIEVAAGGEVPGVDFWLLSVRLARVSGALSDASGNPARGYVVMLNPARLDGARLGGIKIAEADTNGRFTLADVAPGAYRLDVRAKAAIEAIAQSGRAGQSQAVNAPEFASVPITVAGEDIDGVAITLTAGYGLKGRVIVEGAAPDPQVLDAMRVSVMPAVGSLSATMLAARASVAADGTFHVRGLMGMRFVRIGGLSAGWALDSVRAGGVDATDEGIEILDNVEGVEIVVTASPTKVSGVVTDAAGKLVPEAAVFIFPEARERRDAPHNRFVTSARAGADGAFTVRSLPAASYFAMAVPALIDGEWAEPEQLERMAAHATRFTLAAGESKTLGLRLHVR